MAETVKTKEALSVLFSEQNLPMHLYFLIKESIKNV